MIISRKTFLITVTIESDVRFSVSPVKLYNGLPTAEYPMKLPRIFDNGLLSIFVARREKKNLTIMI